MALFQLMFTVATKADSNLTYAFSSVDTKVNGKFKGSFFKVWDQKVNFVIVKKSLPANATKAESLAPWGVGVRSQAIGVRRTA